MAAVVGLELEHGPVPVGDERAWRRGAYNLAAIEKRTPALWHAPVTLLL
jgi:hypothetical protein